MAARQGNATGERLGARTLSRRSPTLNSAPPLSLRCSQRDGCRARGWPWPVSVDRVLAQYGRCTRSRGAHQVGNYSGVNLPQGRAGQPRQARMAGISRPAAARPPLTSQEEEGGGGHAGGRAGKKSAGVQGGTCGLPLSPPLPCCAGPSARCRTSDCSNAVLRAKSEYFPGWGSYALRILSDATSLLVRGFPLLQGSRMQHALSLLPPLLIWTSDPSPCFSAHAPRVPRESPSRLLTKLLPALPVSALSSDPRSPRALADASDPP